MCLCYSPQQADLATLFRAAAAASKSSAKAMPMPMNPDNYMWITIWWDRQLPAGQGLAGKAEAKRVQPHNCRVAGMTEKLTTWCVALCHLRVRSVGKGRGVN